jgi:hypothetical protein
VPLASLPDEWLYCEAWCAPKTKAKAKSIDMCQNPLTKEYKLDMARRVADPLWSRLDDYLATVVEVAANNSRGDAPLKRAPPFKRALAGAFVTGEADGGEKEGDQGENRGDKAEGEL